MNDFNALPDEQKRRIAYLSERYVADTITEIEGEELLRLFDEYPQAVEILRRHLFFDLDLQARFLPLDPDTIIKNATLSEMDLLAVQAFEQTRLAEESCPSLPPKSLLPSVQSEPKSILAGTLIVAALLVFFLLAVLQEFQLVSFPDTKTDIVASKPFHSIGIVTAVADTVFDPDKPMVQLNQRLTKEEINLLDGMIEMKLNNGVRLVLEGPGSLRLQSEMKTFCAQGRLSVQVPPEGKGFEVATSQMTVRDLGTKFVLDISEDQTDLHVLQGEVVSNWLTSEWFSFTEGKGVRVDANNKIRQLAADAALFVTPENVTAKFKSFFQKKEIAYSATLARFHKEPALMALLDSDANDFGSPRIFADRTRTGSLPNRKAFAFTNANTRVEFSLPKPVESLTFWTSVRLDRFDRANTLLLSERFYEDSGILWQIGMDGTIQFHQRTGRQVRQYDSPPVIGREKEGVWLHLALVVDAENRTVSHFLNNRLVASVPYDPNPITIGEVVVGNEPLKHRKKTRRYWNGLMDALVILERPLESTEWTLFDFNP